MKKYRSIETDNISHDSVSNQQHIFINQMKAQGRICQNNSQSANNTTILFSLKSKHRDGRSKLNVRLDVSVFNDSNGRTDDPKDGSQDNIKNAEFLPEFSYSKSSQMRAFFTPSEKINTSQAQAIFQLENDNIFQQCIKKAAPVKGHFRIMRPKPISSYCQICKQTFQNYLQHIEHPSHKKKQAQQSKSTKMIEDLMTSLDFSAKRARSQKLVRFQEQEDQQILFVNQSSKIKIIQNDVTMTPMRIVKTKNYQNQTKTNISSSTNICDKMQDEQKFSNTILLLN